MVEQDITTRAKELGYLLDGFYPVRPYFILARCEVGAPLANRAAALAWLDQMAGAQQQRDATIRQAAAQDAADNEQEY